MRSLIIAVILGLLALRPALAADAACDERALDCCHQIIATCRQVCVKCVAPPAHKCVTPLSPCVEICSRPLCHKPVVTCDPCVEICRDCVCHKPATALLIHPCGEQKPCLSGSKELIMQECGCAKCSPCSPSGWAD